MPFFGWTCIKLERGRQKSALPVSPYVCIAPRRRNVPIYYGTSVDNARWLNPPPPPPSTKWVRCFQQRTAASGLADDEGLTYNCSGYTGVIVFVVLLLQYCCSQHPRDVTITRLHPPARRAWEQTASQHCRTPCRSSERLATACRANYC